MPQQRESLFPSLAGARAPCMVGGMRLLPILLSALLPATLSVKTQAEETRKDLFEMEEFEKPPHDYWKRTPKDRFSRMMEEVAAGRVTLEPADEKTFLLSILRGLEVPVSSQMLVFSSTSLQSGRINAGNPRALYFNEDTTVGFVPGGRIEIASFDPEVGVVFQIFDPLVRRQLPRHERSTRCMNCHADTPSARLPGLVIDSVAVSFDGSSLETYRHDENGHMVPLENRFGGWHLTGGHNIPKTHANLIGRLSPQGLKTTDNPPGQNCDLTRYPLPTSDILPQLVHEHQVGFTNRVTQAIYLERRIAASGKDEPAERDRLAGELADYILFREEAKLPAAGMQGDPEYVKAFLAHDPRTAALRQFDLRSRMFRLRCSYMLGSAVWAAAPAETKQRVYARMAAALAPAGESHLPAPERLEIRKALEALLPGVLEGAK